MILTLKGRDNVFYKNSNLIKKSNMIKISKDTYSVFVSIMLFSRHRNNIVTNKIRVQCH
jgi:hypothetical protein